MDCDFDLCLLSDLCFFDFFWLSSPWSRFRFFSPCEDLSFFDDFDLCFSEGIVASVGCAGCAGFGIDIFNAGCLKS
jgi:hypothetical protein